MHLTNKMLLYIMFFVLVRTVSSQLLSETSAARIFKRLERLENDVFTNRKNMNEEIQLCREDIYTLSNRLTESSGHVARNDKEPVAIAPQGASDFDASVSQYENLLNAFKREKSENIILRKKFEEMRKQHDFEIRNLREMFNNIVSGLNSTDMALRSEIDTIKNEEMNNAFNREKSVNIMLQQKFDEHIKEHNFEIGNIRETLKNVNSRLDRADRRLHSEIDTMKHEAKANLSATQKLVHDSYSVCQKDINHTRSYFDDGLKRVNESLTNRSLNAFQELSRITSDMVSLKSSREILNNVTDDLRQIQRIHQTSCDIVEQSGEYNIYPRSHPNGIRVYRDKESTNKGWIVIQRRADGSVTFIRNWADYKAGFGNLSADFWLGNENIYQLTKNKPRELKIDMEAFNGTKRYALYSQFSISSESEKYKLHVAGYSGDAGDDLAKSSYPGGNIHNGQSFSTFDSDNDNSTECWACVYWSGWWYHYHFRVNLNGRYYQESEDFRDTHGIHWYSFTEFWSSLKFVSMNIR